MLRIAVVTAHFPVSSFPTKGRPAYETIRVLSRKSAVEVFYPRAKYPSALRPQSYTHHDLEGSFRLPGVDVGYYDYPAMPLVSRPMNGWIAARKLLPHVRRFAPDLIFSYFLYPDAYAALKIAKSLSVPVVAMGVGSDVHSVGDKLSFIHTRTVLRESDFLLAISEDLRRRMVFMGASPDRTRTVVSGCDSDVFYPRDRVQARRALKINEDEDAVVYVGRLDVKKGLRELVEAAAILHADRPSVHAYIVGDGPDKQAILNAIRNYGAGAFVHMLPGCTFDEVANWMCASDLVTLPSYMEGCPNVVLEALACGRPVVATEVGGIPEIMNDDCGRTVPARDAHALARAFASVLERSWDEGAISTQMGRNWNMVAGELLNIFESVHSKSKSVVA